ncbi:hypothetical protein [Amycolatopsis pithecellobii]|uniref:PPE domain-containing protein n=1 Tax=Amycolatopsis pithecellobii TaxID=664692 RepID=A0A6N7YZT3_9PSEU|nr:hypothetical protein [Amycolatopsis pithecellobii]MTD52770.1 hypothetical protein [Amycolatopsis pithecellobii]
MGGLDGTQIYNNFNAGRPEVLQAIGDTIAELSRGYSDEAQAIAELQSRMNKAWTGASGDAASAGAGPLAVAFNASSYPLDQTTNAMNVQTGSLEMAKSTVVPVPPAPEKPSGWTVGLKAAIPIVGPSLAVGDIKSYQDGMSQHNAANETNVRVMDQYSSATSSTQSTIPMSYQPLPIDGTSVGIKSAGLNVTAGHLNSEYTTNLNSPTSTPTPSAGQVTTGGSIAPSPTFNGGRPVITSPAPSGTTNPVSTPPPLVGGTSTPTTGGTRASTSGPGGQNRGPGRTGDSAGRVSNGNSAANRLYGTDNEKLRGGTGRGGGAAEERLGRATENGKVSENGRLTENGKPTENRLGAGKNTGSGNFAGAAEEAAASRNAAKGANGAPLGTAGQRGRGEDDEEHQRPDYLLEADPDSIFGTDVRATPPVIGE